MVFAILLFVCPLCYEDAFSKLARDIAKVAAEHSASVGASKTQTGKDQITEKNNERLLEIATESTKERMEFEYKIQDVDRDSDGNFSLILEPGKSSPDSDLVKRRSLKIPITRELGESLFPGDVLAFSGKLRMGSESRTKQAVPFAVIRPEGLKLLAIWIDEIEVGESKPEKKDEKLSKSVAVSPKEFLSAIDRVFKDARSEIASGKTSADKQDFADKHAKIIVETIEEYDGQDFEFETKIDDVVRGNRQDELAVIVSHSEPIRWFKPSSGKAAPLKTVDKLRISIANEDRSEFAVGRSITLRAKLSVTTIEWYDSPETNFAWVIVDSNFVAGGLAKVPTRTVVLKLRDIETEFIPEKSSAKPKKR